MPRLTAILATVALLLAATPAEAHKLKVFATAIGPRIEGSAYFVGGGPAAGAKVTITTPDGTPIAAIATDAQGNFAIIAASRTDHVIAVDSGDGHVGRFTVLARDLPGDLPGGLPQPAASGAPAMDPPANAPVAGIQPHLTADGMRELVGEAVARQIVPLREQLNGYEDRVRIHDILGGLGYILGLAGLALWLRARRTAGPRR